MPKGRTTVDRTRLILLLGGAMLVLGLVTAMVLPWYVLEDPGDVDRAWAAGICGGFLVATLGAILLLTGVFRVLSARRMEGQPPVTPPAGHECPHVPPPPSASPPSGEGQGGERDGPGGSV